MAQSNSDELAAQAKIEKSVLDAVQKGLTRVSDLVSYCGPELIDVKVGETKRELDVPQVSRAIENMIENGLLVRRQKRGLGQLKLALTEAGREAAPAITEQEAELLFNYGVGRTSLRVLAVILEFERRTGSLPRIHDIRTESDLDLVTYQIQPLYAQLLRTDLAENSGLFRFRVAPTPRGRQVVNEFSGLL